MAKKNQLNVSVGVDTKGYKKSWEEAISITQGSGKDIEKEADKMARAVSKKLEGMSVKSQARQLENLVIKMQEAGMAGTKAFTMAATSAGKLKAEIDDAKGIIAAMRPDAPFNALNTTLGAGAQAFAGVQGAMALFGAESENVQKTLLKVQAAMAFAEGFKALDGLSDGFQQLNLVIKANPLIAGATVVAGVAAAMYALANSVDTTAEASERLNAVQLKVFDSTIKEKTEIGALISRYNDVNTTYGEKLDIQRQLVNMSPEYLGGISQERVETDKVNSAVAGYIQVLELKARAQAYQELYVAELKKEYEATKDVGGLWDKIISGLDPMQMPLSQMQQAAAAHGVEAKNLLGIYTELYKRVSDLSKKQGEMFGAPDKPATKSKASGGSRERVPTQGELNMGQAEDFANIADGAWNAATGMTEYKSAIDEVAKGTDQLKANNDAFIALTPEQIAASNAKIAAMTKEEEAAAKLKYENSLLEASALSAQQSIASAFDSMGTSIMNSMGLAESGFEGFISKLGQTVFEALGMLLSNAIGNAILGATAAGAATGPAAPIVTPALITTMVGGVIAAFGAIPKFEDGGIVGGNSYYGDKLLARVNSGELILSHDQQKQMYSNMQQGNGSLMTKLSRNDLIIWLDKGGNDMRR